MASKNHDLFNILNLGKTLCSYGQKKFNLIYSLVLIWYTLSIQCNMYIRTYKMFPHI